MGRGPLTVRMRAVCVYVVVGTAHVATLPGLEDLHVPAADPGRKVAVALGDAEGGTAAFSRGEHKALAYEVAAKEKREAWAKRPAWKGGPTINALQSSLAAASPASARLGAVVAATVAALTVQTPLRAHYGSRRFGSLRLKVCFCAAGTRTRAHSAGDRSPHVIGGGHSQTSARLR